MKYLCVILFLILSCTPTPQPKTKVTIVTPLKVDTTEWVCEDSDGHTLTCNSNEDCCSGFSCVLDRSISRSIKTCLYAGEAKAGSNVKKDLSGTEQEGEPKRTTRDQ